ncbi:C-type lectin domain family 12 member A isoform X2 [Arvicola amphibius]|uniref:C-type lectin domain family 12 member A isoform X2 n=1 Tax=Arvicola amphibius TaxID=1047088 RepID=UPI0018E3ECE2|nr:C-type lectin domain family 12 member A isoform X2 [Arvicola amphibius]
MLYLHHVVRDSDKKENLQTSDKCGGKVPSAPSYSQHKVVLILTVLCILLLIGLGVLGGLFYTTLETEMIKSNQLQNIREELQRNVSLQLMHNINSSKRIRNLSAMLQKTATQLCRELYKNKPEHKCKPCPKGSEWYEDSCYSKRNEYETWQVSEMLCSARNGSLLKIKNRRVLEFIKSKNLKGYWLGLSPRTKTLHYEELNENMFLSAGFERSTYDLSHMYCGHIEGRYVYYSPCTNKKYAMCVETASTVQVESVLNDLPEERK